VSLVARGDPAAADEFAHGAILPEGVSVTALRSRPASAIGRVLSLENDPEELLAPWVTIFVSRKGATSAAGIMVSAERNATQDRRAEAQRSQTLKTFTNPKLHYAFRT